MVEHTPENCEKLASEIVEGMDLKTLISCMTDVIANNYISDKSLFDNDVEDSEWEPTKE